MGREDGAEDAWAYASAANARDAAPLADGGRRSARARRGRIGADGGGGGRARQSALRIAPRRAECARAIRVEPERPRPSPSELCRRGAVAVRQSSRAAGG